MVFTRQQNILSYSLEIYCEEIFTRKTAGHIRKLQTVFAGESIFGRQDVISVLGIGKSSASDILNKMLSKEIIEPVTGHGKGRDKFK